MRDELINFKTAKLAKEKGFVGLYPTTDYILMYFDNGIGVLGEQQGEDDCRDDFYLAPTQSLLQKWLRDVHSIHIKIEQEERNTKFYIHLYENIKLVRLELGDDITDYEFNSYEEALEVGLQEALKIINI